ncbi:MAG: hypothetical protein VW338_08835 [Rhodospirillaceae bacterium]
MAHLAAGRARRGAVEPDQTDGEILLDIVQEAMFRQVGMVGEGTVYLAPVVVIAGNDEIGHGQPVEPLARDGVFVGVADIVDIAGDDDRVRADGKAVQVFDDARQVAGRIDAPVGEPAAGPDVGIGDQGDQHEASIGPAGDLFISGIAFVFVRKISYDGTLHERKEEAVSDDRPPEYFADLISNVSHANGVFRVTFAEQEAENSVRNTVRILIPANQLQNVMQGIANAANEIRAKMQQAQAGAAETIGSPAAEDEGKEGGRKKS